VSSSLTSPELLADVLQVVHERPTYGYRRVTAMLRKRLNRPVNHKRVYRLMRANGLLLQRHTGRPVRAHTGKVITLRPNTRWCSDAFGVQCPNGEQLQVAFSMDCCDREVMSWVTSTRGIDGELVRDLMTESIEQRFGCGARAPHKLQWLSDNGPGYTARDTVRHGRALGFDVRTTPAYSPQSNGMAEAFVKTFKRDYVYVNDFNSADELRSKLAGWFNDYNANAPHKGLKMMSPKEYQRSLDHAA
jgi:putative transposase